MTTRAYFGGVAVVSFEGLESAGLIPAANQMAEGHDSALVRAVGENDFGLPHKNLTQLESLPITPNTSILSHQYSWGSVGKEHELFARVKEFELSTARMMEHYKKCTGLSEKKIREILLPAEDVWLSAKEAVKYGIADKIVSTY